MTAQFNFESKRPPVLKTYEMLTIPAQRPQNAPPGQAPTAPQGSAQGPAPSPAVNPAAVFTKAFHEAEMTLEETAPQRLYAAYRIVREMARTRSLVRDDESLYEAMPPDPTGEAADPWLIPTPFTPPPPMPGPRPIFSGTVIEKMKEAETKTYTTFHDFLSNVTANIPGVPLLPPPIPQASLNSLNEPIRNYDPNKDTALRLYISIIRHTAQFIGLDCASMADPDLGRYGLLGMFDPNTIRSVFPSRLQIYTYESLIVQQTLQLIVQNGMPKARQDLTHYYGFATHEINSLIKLAKAEARRSTEGDIEEDRGIMVLRLEDYMHRSREALDLKAELGAFKQLSIILGLAKGEDNDTMKDFFGVVKQVHQERKQVTNTAPLQLPEQ